MSYFNNLAIKLKLLIGFCIVLIISILIGLLGLRGVGIMSARTTDMYENMILPLSYVSDISTSFQKVKVLTKELVAAKSDEEIQVISKEIRSLRSRITSLLKDLDNCKLNDEDRKYIQNFKNSRVNYAKGLDQLDQLAKDNKKEEAAILLNGEMETYANEEEEHVIELDSSQVAKASKINNENIQLANTTQTSIIIFIIIGFLIGFGLAIKIANYLSKTLNLVTEKMQILNTVCFTNLAGGINQLAAGDLNIKITAAIEPIEIKNNDELGMLAGNINQIISKMHSTVDSTETAISSIKGLVDESKTLVDAAAEGKLSIRGDSSIYKGSYKELIVGLNNIFDSFVQPINDSGKVLEQMALGDLTVRMAGEYKGDYSSIKYNINLLADSFSSALSEVTEAVQATASASNEISSSSEQMAAGAHEQSSQIVEVAGAVEEMTKTILESHKNTSFAAETAKKSGAIAKEGGVVVNQTIDGMNRVAQTVKKSADIVFALGNSSNEIGDIIQVIEDIADQTNLLALNAAIEAARAGEQGRGFAVVADEVRKLAERTTKATKEIAGMIKQIQVDTADVVETMRQGTDEVEKGKQLADLAGQSLLQIINGAEEVVNIVAQVASASEEQSATSEQISKNVEAISSVTQQSAAGVEQIAHAAEDLSRLTINLQEMVSKFKIDERAINNHINKSSPREQGHPKIRSNGFK